MNSILFTLLIGLLAQNVFAQTLGAEVILDGLKVHPEGDKNVFASSFEYRNGQLFIVHVEPPISKKVNGINLHTVLRKGVRQDNGSWSWESKIIESRTLLDPWHNQASVGLDKNGYVHVAYNMHNMPWQYAVSKQPYDISAFEFRGQAVTDNELMAVKIENKTPFPHVGSAAISGNQITYPIFLVDRDKNLFVTYRYALKPARSWENRDFAGGIARYDTELRRWFQIGGGFVINNIDAKLLNGQLTATQRPFAFSPGYSVYLPTIAFDSNNGMHVFWNWRREGAGMETIHPSYAYSPDGDNFFSSDGAPYSLPISIAEINSLADSDTRQFYANKTVAVTLTGNPVAVVQPVSGGRELLTIDKASGSIRIEKTPESAQNILIDNSGRQWLFSTGIRVFMRETEKLPWRFIGTIGSGLCSPKAKYYSDELRFVLEAKSCTSMAVSLFTFRR